MPGRKKKDKKEEDLYYILQSGAFAGGFQAEIMKGLYALAKKKHPEWIEENKIENEIPKIKQI